MKFNSFIDYLCHSVSVCLSVRRKNGTKKQI